MRIAIIIFVFSLMGDYLQAQDSETDYRKGKINLNSLILKIISKGDSAMTAGDFTLSERFYLQACKYTDTLIYCLTSAEPIKGKSILFTTKKKHLYFFAYEKLASLYTMAGNQKKSDEIYRISSKKREQVFERRSVHRVYPHIGLGQLYFQVGDYDKALAHFTEGAALLDRATTTGFNFDVLRYQLYGFHFETSLQKGRTSEAWKYLQRYFYALNTLSPTSEQLATAFEMKARYFLISGNKAQSRLFLSRAEKKLTSTQAVFSKAEAKVLRTKALYFWTGGNYDSATVAFTSLLQSYERNIRKNFPAMSEYEREQFFVSLKKDFDLFNSFVGSSLKKGISTPQQLEVLYNSQLFTKALLLNEITKTRKNLLSSSNTVLIGKVKEWQQARDQMARLFYDGNSKSNFEVLQLEQRINSLEKEINETASAITSSKEEVKWQQVQEAVKKSEAAVEIIRAREFDLNLAMNPGINFSDSVFYVFLMLQPGFSAPQGFMLSHGNMLEGRYLSHYRNCVRQQVSDELSYQYFWKPLRDHLNGVTKIFISADGVYNQINLNVLQNPANGQYILDETDLIFVTNTKDLTNTNQEPKTTTAYLFGRPAFGTATSDAVNTKVPSERSLTLRALGDRDLLDFTQQEFADLPGTTAEIESIEKILSNHNWSPKVFLNSQASEENLKAIRNASVLHVATHGFFQPDDGRQVNSMIRSGIILSGIKSKSVNREDGILTAYEATNLSLEETRLVVLSACETGLGELKNGEGVYGLQRGLKVAGAKNLLMSLWKVDDAATSELMENFYQEWLGGEEIHRAFRQSQMKLRTKYPSPFYWGAFILLGD